MQAIRFKKINSFNVVFLFVSSLLLLFIFAPILGIYIKTSTLDIFRASIDKEVHESIQLTLAISAISTLLFSILAIPFAYYLARHDFMFKSVLLGLINLPIVIPHTAAGIALLGFINRDTLVGKFGEMLGLNFIGTSAGIMIAMAFVSVPFLINAAYNGFKEVPERIENAAYTLGATKWQTFFKISLPLAWRSIVSGGVMMFARGISEFGAVVIIAYHPMTAPVLIYERFTSFGLKYSQPVAALFILISLIVLIMFLYTSRKNK